MEVIYGLIPGMLILGLIAVGVLFWAARSGQFEDLEGDAHRILMDEDEPAEEPYEQVEPGVYRVPGGFSLKDLNELIGAALEDEEHETVAGFLMKLLDKVPEPGDRVEYRGIRFTVESCEGKRAASLRIRILPKAHSHSEDRS